MMIPAHLALSCVGAIGTPRVAHRIRDMDILPVSQLAYQHFGADALWFQANVPFFDCSDRQITDIYYYRWKLYKAHIRNLGSKGYLITEFLDDVGWQKQPYAMLNDAT